MSSQVLSFEVALDLIFELINKKQKEKTQNTKGKFLESFFLPFNVLILGKYF